MTLLIRESDYPDTSISFYDVNGTLLLQYMAHACLLSRAIALKRMIDYPWRRRRSSAESREEAFGEKKMTHLVNDIHQVRIEIKKIHPNERIIEALQTFMQCFYADLSPERIDDILLQKITRDLVCLHDMGSSYGFGDLVSTCENIVTRCMTRELCEGLLEHFIDVHSRSVLPNGSRVVATAITWARQCTSGYRWRTQLLSYLDDILTESSLTSCDPTRPNPTRLVIRKCENCWTVKDSPFPCLIVTNTFTVRPHSAMRITLVWKKLGNGNFALSIKSSQGYSCPPVMYISDFYKCGSWDRQNRILKGTQDEVMLPAHETDKLFYAQCMCCEKRAPCYVYCLNLISDETETSSMDCD